jgi:galactokinase
MARLCQRAENEFVGARCGIMDQFVSVRGKKDQALLLDCRSLEYRHVPLPEDAARDLQHDGVAQHIRWGIQSETERVQDGSVFLCAEKAWCEGAARHSVGDLQEWEAGMPQIVRKRCRHFITEDERVIKAVRALEEQDVSLFGNLMGESHASLRDDFEVSCDELDLMVELAVRVEGVYGARSRCIGDELPFMGASNA